MMFLANENQMKAGVAILKTEKIDFIMFKIISLILTALGLRGCRWLFQIVASGGCSPVVVRGLLIAVTSPVAEHGL